MERTRYKPSAILVSDFHLREDIPICWIGDFQKEQWDSLKFIRSQQIRYGCPVICAGDLFHHWKPSPWLLTQAFQFIPNYFSVVYGQHDLPSHNWELREKSGIYNLEKTGRVHVLDGCHYGQEPVEASMEIDDKKILIWHHMAYIDPPYPEATGGNALMLLRKHPQFSLIVTGDNHKSFSVTYGNQILVNPGSLTRQTADQMDFQPRVALWYAEDNDIVWVNIPIQQGVISREHIDIKERRDARIDAFISKLDTDYKTELSFEDNLEAFFNKNEIRNSVKQIIYRSLE